MLRVALALALFFAAIASARAGLDEGVAAHDRGDYAMAFREFLPLAQQGNASAQYNLGLMYYHGKGVPQDYAEAAKWYRLAADQSNVDAQVNLGVMYRHGQGVPQDYAEAAKWYRLAADQGDGAAQVNLGAAYDKGQGVPQDYAEAVKWFRKAADQGLDVAQYNLGLMYRLGQGVPQDYAEAAKWYRRAADQGNARAQHALGLSYVGGQGVPQDYVQAHKWLNLAASGYPASEPENRSNSIKWRDVTTANMTRAQIAEAQELARNFVPRQQTATMPAPPPVPSPKKRELESTGSGFAVSKAGHVLTNAHVIEGCAEVRAKPPGAAAAKAEVVARDGRGDLALLKAAFAPAAVASFREGKRIRQGEAVVAVGYPLHGLLASEANVSPGAVSALSGLRDDARHLQITAPVQQGNSGGPLLDASGNVVGVVVAKLDALKVAGITGDIPQNVNFAIKAELATGFLLAHGIVAETAPSAVERKPADIGEAAKRFTLLIECWK